MNYIFQRKQLAEHVLFTSAFPPRSWNILNRRKKSLLKEIKPAKSENSSNNRTDKEKSILSSLNNVYTEE